MYIYVCVWIYIRIYNMSVHLLYWKEMNFHIYVCMDGCMYEYTYHYLLWKVLFKFERKLVGMSVHVYIYTFVCIYVCMYINDCVRYIVPVQDCRFWILPKSFLFAFQFKKLAYSMKLLCTYIRVYIYPFGFGVVLVRV